MNCGQLLMDLVLIFYKITNMFQLACSLCTTSYLCLFCNSSLTEALLNALAIKMPNSCKRIWKTKNVQRKPHILLRTTSSGKYQGLRLRRGEHSHNESQKVCIPAFREVQFSSLLCNIS